MDLRALRADRTNRQALDELSRKQAEILKEREEIQSKEAQKQADNQNRMEEEKSRQQSLKIEQHLIGQCVEIFDYAIKKLHEILISLSRDSGDKLTYDFRDISTAYNSSFF